MNLKNPSEYLEYVANVFFDKKNKVVNVEGFNSECIMQTDFKIKKGKYQIIRDVYQPITKKEFQRFLERNKKKNLTCAAIIPALILAGESSAKIYNLNIKESHKFYNPLTKKHYYTTASRI